ncbi:hypothetical protein ACFULT_22235 [Rhodococcus sp. NPDC057297]|uniref:hypothetical protein n=1 Tax=Rhodococcus sp. NPDC057297 TaxID=3346090 RepID=UPI003641598D
MDTSVTLAKIALMLAALTLGLALYYTRHYIVGPSITRNYNQAVVYWSLTGLFFTVSALSRPAFSTTDTAVAVALIVVCTALPIVYLRKTRRAHRPTFLEGIATDDIIDRARNTRESD